MLRADGRVVFGLIRPVQPDADILAVRDRLHEDGLNGDVGVHRRGDGLSGERNHHPGTFSQMGLAPSIGMGPLIIFAWMATGWLTANGTCPSVRTTPTTRALSSTPHTTALFLV